MVRFIFSLLFIFSSLSLTAQTLTSVVLDAKTKKPVADAVVYLDGTAISTVTDAKGEFTLSLNKRLNTNLILSHLIYETIVIYNPFDSIPSKLFLKAKDNLLPDAVVTTDRFTREQKLHAFREYFLGNDKAAKQCKILNENDIQFSYNTDSKTLSARCNKPIEVVNGYLGYKLKFNLMEFSVSYYDISLNSKNVKLSLFYGTSLFEDVMPNEQKTAKRRVDTYNESTNHFFKQLISDSLHQAKYQIFNRATQVKPESYLSFKDTLSLKRLTVLPDTDIDKIVGGIKKPVSGKLSVLYRKKIQSAIVFLANTFWIDQYGNISDVDKLMYSGHFGKQRISRMLPLDFMP